MGYSLGGFMVILVAGLIVCLAPLSNIVLWVFDIVFLAVKKKHVMPLIVLTAINTILALLFSGLVVGGCLTVIMQPGKTSGGIYMAISIAEFLLFLAINAVLLVLLIVKEVKLSKQTET